MPAERRPPRAHRRPRLRDGGGLGRAGDPAESRGAWDRPLRRAAEREGAEPQAAADRVLRSGRARRVRPVAARGRRRHRRRRRRGARRRSRRGAGRERRGKPAPSLRAHLDRVVTRLTSCVAAGALPPGLEARGRAVLAGLGDDRAASRSLRGERGRSSSSSFARWTTRLMDAARAADAGEQLAASGARPSRNWRRSEAAWRPTTSPARWPAATDKLLRDRWKLPTLYERLRHRYVAAVVDG